MVGEGRAEEGYCTGVRAAPVATSRPCAPPSAQAPSLFCRRQEYNWTVHIGPGGHHQWKPNNKNGSNEPLPDIMMLTSDIALIVDPAYRVVGAEVVEVPLLEARRLGTAPGGSGVAPQAIAGCGCFIAAARSAPCPGRLSGTQALPLPAAGIPLQIVEQFAADQAALDKAFSHAWYKLTTRDMGPYVRCLGTPAPPQPFQNPLPPPPSPLPNYDAVRRCLGGDSQ